DTDFTVFKGLRAQGMNFAYVNGINHYHTQLDSVEAINPGSLQHAGSYALALANHFGNTSTSHARTTNAVYFNVLGASFIRYPGALIIPLLLLTALLFGFVVVQGLRAGELRVRGIALGFVGLLCAMLASAALVWVAWWLVRLVQRSYRWVPWGEPYHSNAYRVGFVLLAIAASSAVYALLRRRANARSLAVGALIWWLILSCLVSVLMPGGSYLFTLPLLFSLLGLALVSVLKLQRATSAYLLLALGALPGVLLWSPMLYNIFVALTLNASWIVAVLVALLCGLVVPLLIPLLGSRRWLLLPGLLTLAAVCLIVGGVLSSGFDKQRPKMNHLFYALDADSGKAVYASSDDGADAWTEQFFKAGGERGPMHEYFPGNPRAFLKSPAPGVQLSAPEAVITEDRTENGVRTLGLRVISRRSAPVVAVYAEPDAEIIDSAVNGQQTSGATSGGGAQPPPVKFWGVQHHAAPAEGFDVLLRTRSGRPFKLFVVDRSYGLPEVPGSSFKPRPEGMMPAPFSTSDVTLVAKSFTF
ncbi:MAG TPA: M28 family peptidase, partial [Pyrinomonadaceae bacterium]